MSTQLRLGAVALVVVFLAGCPGPTDKCAKVSCSIAGQTCDPADGICKVSGGGGGGGSGGGGGGSGGACTPACAAPTAVCDNGICRTCTAAGGCAAPTPFCNTSAAGGFGACVECMGDPACTDAAKPVCDLLTHACIGSAPTGGGTCTDPMVVHFSALSDGGLGARFVAETAVAAANNQPDGGTCTSGAIGGELVYRLDLTSTQDLIVSSTGDAGVDPVIYLRNTPCANGAELTCADSTFSGDTETFTEFGLAAGTYYLFVDNYEAAGGEQFVSIDVAPPTPPLANDECPGTALVFAAGTATATGQTGTATNSNVTADSTPSCSTTARSTGKDVVYSYTLTQAQDVTITVTPTGASPSFRPVTSVRRSCASAATVDELGCTYTSSTSPSVVSLVNQQPGTYYLWVDGASSTSGPFSLQVVLTAATIPPAGNLCSTALAAPSTDGGVWRVDLSTFLAPPNAEKGSCGNGTGGKDIIYSFTTAAAQDINIVAKSILSPDGGSSDPVVYVRSSPCASGAELACADDTYGGGTESVRLRAQAAGTYYLFVKGYSASSSRLMDVSLAVSAPTYPAAGNYCSTALTVPNTSGTPWRVDLTPFYPTLTPEIGACNYGTGGAGVVYSLTTTAPHDINVTAAAVPLADGGLGTSNPVVYIRNSPCATGNELVCADATSVGGSESVRLRAQDAGTYYVFVSGYAQPSSGLTDVTAVVSAPTYPPAGNYCSTALTVPNTSGTPWRVDLTPFYPSLASEIGACNYGTGGAGVVYSLTTTAPHDINVTAAAVPLADGGLGTSNPVVYIRNSPCATGNELVCADATSVGGSESVRLKAQDAGTYYVFVSGYSQYSSGLTDVTALLSAPTYPPPGDSCATPIALPKTDGTTWRVDFGTFNHDETGDFCGSSSGPDVVYTLNLAVPHGVKATATPVALADGGFAGNDPYIFIRESPCATGAELACEDVGYPGEPELMVVNPGADAGPTVLDAGTYYIVFGNWADAPSPTDLSVTVGP